MYRTGAEAHATSHNIQPKSSAIQPLPVASTMVSRSNAGATEMRSTNSGTGHLGHLPPPSSLAILSHSGLRNPTPGTSAPLRGHHPPSSGAGKHRQHATNVSSATQAKSGSRRRSQGTRRGSHPTGKLSVSSGAPNGHSQGRQGPSDDLTGNSRSGHLAPMEPCAPVGAGDGSTVTRPTSGRNRSQSGSTTHALLPAQGFRAVPTSDAVPNGVASGSGPHSASRHDVGSRGHSGVGTAAAVRGGARKTPVQVPLQGRRLPNGAMRGTPLAPPATLQPPAVAQAPNQAGAGVPNAEQPPPQATLGPPAVLPSHHTRAVGPPQAAAPVTAPAVTTAAAATAKITYTLPHQNMAEGHFYVVLGEDIDISTGRFKILSLLGEGTFGKVVEAWDRKHRIYCAVKIVRNVPKYTRDAKIEIQYMEKVRQADPEDKYPLMKIQRYFENDQGHMCIVMPKYGPCLLDWIQSHGPFPMRHLAEITFQCGMALDFLHGKGYIHTDLKPENILLESSTVDKSSLERHAPALPCKVRICDLGGCCSQNHCTHSIVSTRHYRSPEVMLQLGWMFPTDMWSIGCILYEIYTGRLLFDTHENVEHLHLMEKILGPLPADMLRRCTTKESLELLDSDLALQKLTKQKSIAKVQRALPLQDIIKDAELCSLLRDLLDYDCNERLTAREMCRHPFVKKYYPEAQGHPCYPTKPSSYGSARNRARYFN